MVLHGLRFAPPMNFIVSLHVPSLRINIDMCLGHLRTSAKSIAIAVMMTVLIFVQDSVQAKPNGCFEQVDATVVPSTWKKIGDYFTNLFVSPAQQNKAQLIRLRASIVKLEAEKQRLVDVVMVYMDQSSGAQAARNLAADKIPSILDHIIDISSELNSMAQEANLFAAEPAFRQLLLTLDAKRIMTLCSLSREAEGGFVDRVVLQRRIEELKAELAAIINAEDALAAYIRKLP